MTNGLIIFLASYILIGQPAIIGWMYSNPELYKLACINTGVLLITLAIVLIFKPSKPKDNTTKIIGKSEEKISRIENGEDVAIVEVEKKEEVIVETNNEEKEENKKTEAIEEKSKEKTAEKSMRETVSIPKIVQPINGYQDSKKKRKKNIKWGQRIVLLITLGLAAIITITLREFLENRGISISLFLGRILYLVIGKLFDISGFFNAKKLFTFRVYVILVLAGIGYGVYTTHKQDKSILPPDFSEKVVSYIQNRFTTDEEDSNINTGDVIYIFEGTGEIISNSEYSTNIETGNVLEEDNIKTDEIVTETIDENTQPEVEIQPENIIENQTNNLSSTEAKKQVTMGEAVKSLVDGATLSTKTNTTFKYVSKSDELYPYFKTAQEKRMIGTDTDPSKIISCETYITMKGIREGRNVGNYTKSEIKSAYWNKAVELGKLNGCKKGAYVTKGNL